MERKSCSLFMLFWFLLISGPVPTLRAAITGTDDVEPTSPPPPLWTSSTDGYIGRTTDGTLTVDNSDSTSNLVSHWGWIGTGSGVTGRVTITGSGSTWTSTALFVGDNDFVGPVGGNGTLNVLNGASVTSVSDSIGYNSRSTGAIKVDGIGTTGIASTYNNCVFMVGYNGNGTLNVTNGGIVHTSRYGCEAYVGFGSGSTGTATVDGVGSQWNDDDMLYVGYQGSGTLKILNGSTVTSRTTYVAACTGSTGTIDFGTSGGTLNTGSLGTSADYLKGTGTINTRGLIGDLDLMLDSTASLTQTLHYNNPGQNVTVNLRLADDPSKNGALGAGWAGNGSLTIKNGVHVTSSDEDMIGNRSGSRGVVTVQGNGSTWTHNGNYVRVGVYGSGTLNIIGGGNGTFCNDCCCVIGDEAGSTGVVTVDGPSSALNSGYMVVGGNGSGTLHITRGGTVNLTNTSGLFTNGLGIYPGSTGVATVSGVNSKWNCSSSRPLYVGYYDGSVGKLTIADGGTVSATGASIHGQSLLNIDVGNHSLLKLNNGNGTITNDGTVRILAGAGAVATTYTPISATTFTNNGTWQAIGGKWDTGSHQFAVSAPVTGSSGTEIAGINLASTQRALVSGNSNWTVGASFLAQSSIIDFTATAISDTTLTSLQSRLATGDSVLSGWEFLADNYTVSETNPVYLSLKVGSGHSLDDLDLWHYNGSNWSVYTAPDLTYDGTYASFTVTNFSGYAVSGLAVPEPSAIILLSVGAASLLVWGWRQRKRTA
jgi:T5SS/PEP-CTERM-associated repeat protein